MLTHTVVDPDDPAFARADEADRQLLRGGRRAPPGRGERLGDGRGLGPRLAPARRRRRSRVRIVEQDAIQTLVDAGFLVVAAGGGGIPVVERPDGRLEGVEAVIDKDFASALLARAVGADLLVHHDRRRPGRGRLRHARPARARRRQRRRGAPPPRRRAVPRRQHGAEDRGGARLPRGGRRRGPHHEPRPPRRRARGARPARASSPPRTPRDRGGRTLSPHGEGRRPVPGRRPAAYSASARARGLERADDLRVAALARVRERRDAVAVGEVARRRRRRRARARSAGAAARPRRGSRPRAARSSRGC